jgi:peptidase A4-like protein
MAQAVPAREAFRKALPYEIVPTHFPGVFTSPPPPENLDPKTTDAKTFIKHGLLWRRPEATERATVRAAWERIASRKWDPKKRIVPRMEVQFGRTHQVKGLKKTEAGYTSNNWGGGVLQGPAGSFTSAVGYWVIPTVGIPPEPQGYEGGWNSSSWIGIDGFFTTNDVLQAGIEQKVDPFGHASFVAWYEWFVSGGDPNQFPYIYQINIPNFSVAPGQTIYCSVQYVGNTAGQLYLANDTTGEHFSITLAPPTGASFNGKDAEWIMEAPDGGEPTASLPSFSPVHFTTALACNSSTIANPQNGDYVNIIGFGKQLTSVALGNDSITIDFTG